MSTFAIELTSPFPAGVRRIALRIRLTVTKMLARLDSDRLYPLAACRTEFFG
jgi:hypothetical protein